MRSLRPRAGQVTVGGAASYLALLRSLLRPGGWGAAPLSLSLASLGWAAQLVPRSRRILCAWTQGLAAGRQGWTWELGSLAWFPSPVPGIRFCSFYLDAVGAATPQRSKAWPPALSSSARCALPGGWGTCLPAATAQPRASACCRLHINTAHTARALERSSGVIPK